MVNNSHSEILMVIGVTKIHFIVTIFLNLILFCYVILNLHGSIFVMLNNEGNIFTAMHVSKLVKK